MKQISIEQYFGAKRNHADATPERVANATDLLAKVNALLLDAVAHGVKLTANPHTKTLISGSKNGQGDGGFRLQTSTTGARKSKHRKGLSVDVADTDGTLDEWITHDILVRHGLWRECKSKTPGWSHLQSIAPKSGNRSFLP